MMLAATSDAEGGGGAHVKAELPVSTTAAASMKVEAPVAERDDPSAAVAETNTKNTNAGVKQLKLRLFQQLARRDPHKHAWAQYWRALQQFLIARLSLEEFHCIVQILLGPDLVDLHNAFIVAILNEAQVNSTATSDDNDDKVAVRRDDEGSNAKAAVKAEPLATTTETPPVKKESDRNGDSSHVKADHNSSNSNTTEKKRSFSTHISSPDDERAVKKLLHFANSKRDTPEKHSDQQSAELLIGLGNVSSRAASNKSSSASQ